MRGVFEGCVVRSCSVMSLTLDKLQADIEWFTREAERLRYEERERRGWAEEGQRLSDNTRKKRQLETGDVKEGDFATFSRQADDLLSDAEACEDLVRELRAIEQVMVERYRAEHPPGEMRE